MSKLSDLTSAAIAGLLGNMTLSKAGLAIGTAPAGFNTANAITFQVNGVIPAVKTAITSGSLAVTHTDNGKVVGGGYVQPAPVAPATSVVVYYTLGLNAAGTVCVVQGYFAGQNIAQIQMGTSAVGDGSIPDVPAGYTPFGVIRVTTTVAATFTPGTTALNAANVAATFTDVSMLPAGLL